MTTFVSIDDDRFFQLCETVQDMADKQIMQEVWSCITALGIKPFKDGNQWCFLYGDNIQEGVCGFGNTIHEAALNFYSEIKTKEVI